MVRNKCPEDVEQIITEAITKVATEVFEMPIHLSNYLMRDLGLTSMETFEVLALIDARLERKFSYEGLMVLGGITRQDLTIQDIADFIRGSWDTDECELQPR